MQKINSLQAVLWDMDGVIVDTFDGHFRSWKETFDELDVPFDLEMFRKTFGMNNRRILPLVMGRELDEAELLRISDRKEVLFRDGIKGSVQLLPGVLEWLLKFKDMGIPQAVASSAPRENIDALLDELAVHDYFQAEAAGADLRGKPDPAVFLLAAELLKVEPKRCLVIEDSVAGVEAARRAGMKCVAVLTTNSADKVADADVIVQDLRSLKVDTVLGLFA